MGLKSASPITLSQLPAQGPKGFPLTLDFTGVARLELDLMLEAMAGQEDFVQSVYVNNQANGGSVELIFSPMSMSIFVRANQQGLFTIIGDGRRMIAVSTIGFKVPLIFINTQIGPSTWAV